MQLCLNFIKIFFTSAKKRLNLMHTRVGDREALYITNAFNFEPVNNIIISGTYSTDITVTAKMGGGFGGGVGGGGWMQMR
jgi:hypothetical protein